MWNNGRCKVQPEISIKNLIPLPNKGKGGKNNPYKRIFHHGKYSYEHRMVMENHLGRKLNKNEHIHHINGNQLDNRIENLKIVSPSEHGKITFEEVFSI